MKEWSTGGDAGMGGTATGGPPPARSLRASTDGGWRRDGSHPRIFGMLLLFMMLVGFFVACGSSSTEVVFGEPVLVSVDNTNDRLFVLEKNGVLFGITASNLADEKEIVPLVNSATNTSIHDLLPRAPTNLKVLQSGATSRLFITGAQTIGGSRVLNRILVLEYDGTTISQASFSPIVLDDGDGGTDESDDTLGGLELDPAASRLYVTDTSASLLFIHSTGDGSEVAGPVAIAGEPNKISLADGRLYVANSTDTEADQVITVVNTADLTTTTIDVDFPSNGIAALNVGGRHLLAVNQATAPHVDIRSVDTATFADAPAIPVGDSSATNGSLDSGNGLTSAVGRLLAVADASGNPYVYIPQIDGSIALVVLQTDLSSFTVTSLASVTNVLEGIAASSASVFVAASSSGNVVFTTIGSTSVSVRF